MRLIHTGLSRDDHLLEREAEELRKSRIQILHQLRMRRSRLLDAIQDETRSVVFSGCDVRPVEAAKTVKSGVGKCDWIPGPVKLGEVLPLNRDEIATLYRSTRSSLRRTKENWNRPPRPSIAAHSERVCRLATGIRTPEITRLHVRF